MELVAELNRETFEGFSETEWHKMRAEDITSTDAAALFGCSPYSTEFEIWHRKKSGDIVTIAENERMRWGVRLQDAIAKGICQDNGWGIMRRKDEYMRLPTLRIGASFDFEVAHGTEKFLLEIKNVGLDAFGKGWLIDGDNIEAPPHIELQAQHQLLVSGLNTIYIGALIGGNRVVLIKRERDHQVIEAICDRVKRFWDSMASGISPAPDFQRDADFIKTLYAYSTPGTILAANDKISKLVVHYKEASAKESEAKKNKDAAKAEMLTLIGTAEKVLGDGFTISAGMIGPTHIEYDREGYRDFRIFTKKTKGISNEKP